MTQDSRSVLDAVRDLVPVLRKNGQQADEDRWLPEENIALLEAAGVWRMSVPKRFGGLEMALADQVEVITEISRGCGTTGWVTGVYVGSAWAATLYPDRTQAEVFADGSVRISIGFAPTGKVTRTDGGWILNGQWRFNSGSKGAHYNMAAAVYETEDGGHGEVLCLVPIREFTFVDDWHVMGGSGTGSVTTVAKDVFVPDHYAVDFEPLMVSDTPDRTNGGADGRNYALLALVLAGGAATSLGIAKAAYELFLERLPGRAITYTPWEDQKQHPVTQIQVATARNKIDAAEALSRGYLKMLQDRADAGVQPTDEEKAIVRGQTGFIHQQAKEAVELLYTLSGGSVIQRSVPFQRFYRDMLAFTQHALVNTNVNLEIQGRVLLGLDPATPYL
ncbi:acyl-CoA dehydrogenase [Saccharothrix sp. ALI-22-I]|uniref:acyl-CoA dehydrogenase family protein n=1 Tax=Saccharothrix sp. ALI-22-I TaxID=1933778 RepID=UPI00097BE9D1|nr:acyl-CoA dehydrogenase family protein [Saccharothrix sp. ALI-22-I]ONI92823.1 acyl-CoA dehydrogenase [Saccharothrix sp. ALI-22-I]